MIDKTFPMIANKCFLFFCIHPIIHKINAIVEMKKLKYIPQNQDIIDIANPIIPIMLCFFINTYPQLGHTSASSETSLLHSGQFIIAILIFSFVYCFLLHVQYNNIFTYLNLVFPLKSLFLLLVHFVYNLSILPLNPHCSKNHTNLVPKMTYFHPYLFQTPSPHLL